MIYFENTEVVGWEAAIRGMRNPMNSWDKSDSDWHNGHYEGSESAITVKEDEWGDGFYDIGPRDQALMFALRCSGSDHRKFMRMIAVYVDITAPLYWWKEFDTYKVGTVANSCSTMHKIGYKEFTIDDFSCNHLGVSVPEYLNDGEETHQNLWEESLKKTIEDLNVARDYYIREQNEKLKKDYWWQMIQLLPSSYNQERTVMMNYEVLVNIYENRKNHKLDEWSEGFMRWIKTLPYYELIIGRTEVSS